MKKRVNGKKRALGSIGLFTAAVCCFGIAATTTVVDNGLKNDSVIAYASETQEKSYQEVWAESITALKTLDVDANYVDYVVAFSNARDAVKHIPDEERAAADMDVYNAAAEKVATDANCLAYFRTTLRGLLATGIKWSHKANYDLHTANFAALAVEKQEALIAYMDGGATADTYAQRVAEANAEFTRIQGALDDVIVAIDALEYVGKVDSKASLDNVADKIKLVYNTDYEAIPANEVAAMAKYISDTTSEATTLEMYDDALAAYNAIVAECKAFDERIVETYNSFTQAEGENFQKYYTKRAIINSLVEDYEKLDDVANDNRKTLITEAAKIDELKASKEDVETKKIALEALIDEIDAVFDYTDAYEAEVVTAREYYDDNIIDDLKSVNTEIDGYVDVLVAAETKLAECKAAVEKLMEDTDKLQDLYDAGSASFTASVNAVSNTRFNFAYDKQRKEYNEAEYDASNTYAQKLAYWETQLSILELAVQPVIDAIEAIGEVKLSDHDIGARINNARTLYDALTSDLERNAVTNYKTLVKAEEELAALTAEAQEWKKAVDAIVVVDSKMSTTNIADLKAVEKTYTDWQADAEKADLASVVAAGGSLYSYDKYIDLLATRTALFAAIDQLALDMAALSTDLTVISADPTAFTTAVEAAIAAFDSIDESVQEEYFTADAAVNKAAYDNYVAAVNLYNNVYKLVGNIIALGDPTLVTMAKYNDIYAYLAEYELLSEENKAIVDNGGYKATLDTAKETVDALKAKRDAWMEAVYALAGEVEKANWDAELYHVNLDAAATLLAEKAGLDNTDNGLDEAFADLDTIITLGNKRVNDINTQIDTLVANQPLKKTDIETLKSIYDIYNNKLHVDSQTKLVKYAEFEVLYNRYVFAQNFDEAVGAIYDDIFVNKNFNSEVPALVGILRSVYVTMDNEMKALIERYDDIQKIEDEYNKFVEEGGEVLNLTAVYNELSALIANLNDADFAAKIQKVADDLAQLDVDYKKAISDLKDELLKADSDINGTIKDLQDAIKAINDELALVDGKISSAITGLKNELSALISKNATDITSLTSKLSDLQVAFDTYKDLTDATIGSIQDDIDALEEALEKAIADLEKADKATNAELVALKDKLSTVTVVLAIISGLALAGVIALFVLKFIKKD